MRLSHERLRREATVTGFRVEILEKIAQLLEPDEIGFSGSGYQLSSPSTVTTSATT